MAAITTQALYDLTRPGLRKISGMYAQIPTQFSMVFEKGVSNMQIERSVEVRMLPLPKLKTEGAAIQFDNNAGERFVFNHEHWEVALGYAITRKAIDDNLYHRQFPASNLALQANFRQAQEIFGANVLNGAFTYNSAIVGDGVALCSASHPYDGGLWANTPSTQLDLNEAGLLSALTQVETGIYNQAGILVMARGRKLVVPPALKWAALRLLHTDLRPGTSDNDINALRASGALGDGVAVLTFLSSPYSWFVQTTIPGLIYLERKPFEMGMEVDFTTQNLMVTGYQRYYFGYDDPKCIWGTSPAS